MFTADLKGTRTWGQKDGGLKLSFTIPNLCLQAIFLGPLSIAIEITKTTEKCILVDPCIGLHDGNARVT